MDFNEKLGLLERGLMRRVDNLGTYIKNLEAEAQKVRAISDEFTSIIEEYKSKPEMRNQLRGDERLIILAGSKTKLRKLLDDPTKFVALVETGRDEFLKNYGSEERRFKVLSEEAQESLPDAEKLLKLIKSNEYHQETLESFINLFLIKVLTDWRDFEQSEKEKEAEKA
jgi:ABC-type Zn uptake system ZnuABC Zn-binding protein ZnuA